MSETHSCPQQVLIVGANGAIASALCHVLANQTEAPQLITISRANLDRQSATYKHLSVALDTPDSVNKVSQFLADNQLAPDWVIHCAGMLNAPDMAPEKSLKAVSLGNLQHALTVNVASHIHLAQAVERGFSVNRNLRWASLSAKVGSIEDNRLGGWYSYRMTKAALNMFVRGIAIEWRHKLNSLCAVAIHPGTTDTPFTQPYQKNIPPDKLYSPQTTAQRITRIMSGLTAADNGHFLNWDGERLPW